MSKSDPFKTGTDTHYKKTRYGYCPKCGKSGVSRERRPNGNDKCESGCTYPSSEATASPDWRISNEEEDDDAPVDPGIESILGFDPEE